MNKRKSEISYLNVLLCLFVVFIHIISYPVGAFEKGSIQFNVAMFPWRAVSFVVPGFIFLSGLKMFLTGKDKKGYGAYLLSRFKTVIVPYIVCFAVFYIFYFVVYDYPLDVKFMLKHLLLGSLVCHMYFIPLLFQYDLLFPLWRIIINKCSPLLVVPFSVAITFLFERHFITMLAIELPEMPFVYNDRILTTYLCYWIIGCYAGKYYDRFIEVLKKNFKTICTLFGISFVLFAYYTYLAFNEIAYIPFMNEVHSLYTVCVIIFLYALAVRLPREIPKFISDIDNQSFNIYLYHMLFVFLANYIVEKLGIVAQGTAFMVRCACAYGLTIALFTVANKMKKKIKNK